MPIGLISARMFSSFGPPLIMSRSVSLLLSLTLVSDARIT